MSLEAINKAREQITEESLKIGGSLANFIEEHLNKVCKTEEVAKHITAEGKSIKDLISKITSEAKKNAKNNVGCLTDEEVLQIIDDYYGIHTKSSSGSGNGNAGTIDILDLM